MCNYNERTRRKPIYNKRKWLICFVIELFTFGLVRYDGKTNDIAKLTKMKTRHFGQKKSGGFSKIPTYPNSAKKLIKL